MARLSQPTSPSLNRSAIDIASAELGNLLSRLQKTVLHTDSDRERRLRSSEFERARVASNLEYARNVLSKLEHDALAIKAPSRRAEVQGHLNGKREILEVLLDRLEDLKQVALDEDDDDDDASTDGEDILSEIIPTPSDSMVDSISTGQPTESSGQEDDAESEFPDTTTIPVTTAPTPAPITASASASAPASTAASQNTRPVQHNQEPTQTSQTLRPRGGPASPSPSSHSTARAALFANRSKPSTPQTSTATAEALLDRQRSEQEALSESILQMAGALKSSSQRFSDTLEADKDVVGRASEGMDKTEQSMEAARGRMGTLKRMTEGKGYIGRLKLYAMVYGLMLVCFLVVFFMPKLRF